MLDCLKGYIGLSAQVATCESGLYVVALPGISLYNIEKIADKSGGYTDILAVFGECEDLAIPKFRSAFIAAMCECWKTFKRDIVDCLICENRDWLKHALKWYIGYEILVQRTSSDRINRFTTLGFNNALELQGRYLKDAETELWNNVQSIDPSQSACFEKPVRCSEQITFVTPII